MGQGLGQRVGGFSKDTRKGDSDRAIADFNKFIQFDPGYVTAHDDRGAAQGSVGAGI